MCGCVLGACVCVRVSVRGWMGRWVSCVNRALIELSGSGVQLRTLDYKTPGSNPALQCETFGQ